MDGRAKVSELGFLTAGGEMGALMRAHDWSNSPLGPLDTWPQSLRTTVGLMLGAETQIVLFWGPKFCALYNDAYASIIGDKRPRALGRPALENWTGLWDGLEPLLQGVRETGKAFAAKNRPFSIERHGDRGETVYFDVSYSAVPDADGSVGGVLCIVSEATERVHALRDLRESEARLRFIGELDEALRASGDAPAAMRAAARLLARRLGATRCAYAAVDADSDRFIIHDDYTMPGSASSAGTYSLDLFGPRAAADMRAGRTLVICNVLSELAPGEGREMFEAIGIEAIVCCPLVKDGRLVAMMAVHQDRSRDWQHNEIALVETVVERCWAHVERVGAEARLRASETRYRTLFESIESGFCIVEVDIEAPGDRIDYRVIEANPAFHQQTGFPDAILGKWLREAAPALEEHWYEIYGRVARTGEPARFEQGSDMLGRWFDVYAFRVGEPEQGRVAIMFNDISARRKAEERLRELNETLERRVAEALAERRVLADVIDGTDIFVQVADRDYTWLAINDAAAAEFARIFGVRPPKAGDSMLEMLKDRPADREAVKAVWSRALAGEEFVEVDEFGDPALDRRYYEMRFRTLRDAGGRAIGAYQFVSDVTERLREQARLKEAEEALRQSQKMEAVGQLTGGIAHDFNNLLTGIVGSLDMLRTRVSQGRLETVDRYITAATTSANRAAALTHRLLAFARRQPLDPRPVQANALVASLEDLFRRTVGETVTLEVVLAGGLWPTLCDPNQLESALLNLVINARDAMPDGGKLTIETCNAHLDEAYIAAQRDVRAGPVRLHLRDGHGNGHAAGRDRARVRSVLHDQAHRSGHRAGAVDGLRVRPPVGGPREDLQRGGSGHHDQDLPAALPRRNRRGNRGVDAGRGAPRRVRRDRAGGRGRAGGAQPDHRGAGGPRLPDAGGGGRTGGAEDPPVPAAHRPPDHRRGSARPERAPARRRRPRKPPRPQGAVHHGLRRERDARRGLPGTRHGDDHEAVCRRCACAEDPVDHLGRRRTIPRAA